MVKVKETASFTLRFVFDADDFSKAKKLRDVINEFGVATSIKLDRNNGLVSRKETRLRSILGCFDNKKNYTTGALWNRYSRFSSTGYKTFVRDLNTLIIQGLIIGDKCFHPKGGRTMAWSKRDVYSDKYPLISDDEDEKR